MFGCQFRHVQPNRKLPQASSGLESRFHDTISASIAVSFSAAIFWRRTEDSSRKAYRCSIQLPALQTFGLSSGCSGTNDWSGEDFGHRTRTELIPDNRQAYRLALRDDVHWPEFGESPRLSVERGWGGVGSRGELADVALTLTALLADIDMSLGVSNPVSRISLERLDVESATVTKLQLSVD